MAMARKEKTKVNAYMRYHSRSELPKAVAFFCGAEGGGVTASPLAPGSALRQVALFGLVFVPPLVVAESDPSLFFTALDYAGTSGTLSA